MIFDNNTLTQAPSGLYLWSYDPESDKMTPNAVLYYGLSFEKATKLQAEGYAWLPVVHDNDRNCLRTYDTDQELGVMFSNDEQAARQYFAAKIEALKKAFGA